MAIRKETVLSSLMYVRARELYSVSYPLAVEGMFSGFKCHFRLDYLAVREVSPRASPSSRGEPRELRKSRLVSVNKFLYFEYVSHWLGCTSSWVKVSVKENEVPTEKNSSRASIVATKASYISN